MPLAAAGRTIRFSGHDWWIKDSAGRHVGPGPNLFSADNVRVINGKLHMRIGQVDGSWQSAEVVSAGSYGYGTYVFDVAMNTDVLDRQVVLGLFTWSDEPADAHRELDIEIARWGNPSNPIGQCVVQPFDTPGHMSRFAVPAGALRMQYEFHWSQERMTCVARTLADDGSAQPSLVHTHQFIQGIPRAGGENVRINLWLLDGRPPSNGQPVEVVVERFVFQPQETQ